MKAWVWFAMVPVIWFTNQYDPWLAKFVLIYFCVMNVGYGLARLAVAITQSRDVE